MVIPQLHKIHLTSTQPLDRITLSLKATNSAGNNTLTRTNYITVNAPAPVANFTASPTSGVSPLTVTFTDTSTNSPTSWDWAFGDGNTSTAQNPSYTYANAGIYTVMLTATNSAGNNTLTRTNYITVNAPAPVANFTASPTSGVSPLSVTFTDTSTDSPNSWDWSFGDGNTSTAQNPSYTYANAGIYTVVLTATNSAGNNTLTRTNYITVNAPAPVANFTASPTSGVSPLTVTFTDTSTDSPTSWDWELQNATVNWTQFSSVQNPSISFPAGNYDIRLTASNLFGNNTTTKFQYITVDNWVAPRTIAPIINAGSTIFIGEEHLDLSTSAGLTDGSVVGYWESAGNVCTSPASKIVLISNAADFTVTDNDYGTGGSISDWYLMAGPFPVGCPNPALAFRVADPTLDVTIYAPAIADDVTGKSVTQGTQLQFGIITNQYAALTTGRWPVYGTSTGDGYIDLKVRTESGGILSNLITDTSGVVRLSSVNVTTQPYYWGTAGLDADTAAGGDAGVPTFAWDTAALINSQPVYEPGIYTVWAECRLNNMMNKYRDANGSAYTGKTVSPTKTITLVSDIVNITVNNDSVVRGNPFSVTITGIPSAYYCLWLKGVSSLDNASDDQPPLITPFQTGVDDGTTANGAICGAYSPQNLGTTIIGDTYHDGSTNTDRYANVSMTTAGTRIVQFNTSTFTKAQNYTIRVEANFDGQVKGDSVDVTVEKDLEAPVANFTASPTSGVSPLTVTFTDTSTDSPTSWDWTFGDGEYLNCPKSIIHVCKCWHLHRCAHCNELRR